ncbi:MAG: aldehyde dehydrogenase family protein [Chitinophagaceae bacterium]|nr:aldehyde dehydrogenase family protein [Chitinophagaceae bacterium]
MDESLLELSGNNTVIVTENADLGIAITASVFGRSRYGRASCTTTRRLIIHEKKFTANLKPC